MYNGKCIPCIYALLCDKITESYEIVFEFLRDEYGLNPHAILSDFELAIVNAIKYVFPKTFVHGCYFHLTHNILKNLKDNCGLFGYLGTNKLDVNLSYQRLKFLPFVPIEDVVLAFDSIKLNSDKVFYPVLDYFEKTYIGELVRVDETTGDEYRKKPTFFMSIWNCYDRVIGGFMRSNNHIEAWHQQFNNNIRNHPTLNQLLNYFLQEQNANELDLSAVGRQDIRFPSTLEIRKTLRYKSLASSYHTYPKDDLVKYLDDFIAAQKFREKVAKNSRVIQDYVAKPFSECDWSN